VASGEVGEGYVPRMEVVPIKNCGAFRQRIDGNGWPGRTNELHASVGPIPEPGPDVSAEDRQRMEWVDVGWQERLVARDWHRRGSQPAQTR
jgi:hypothetical protein